MRIKQGFHLVGVGEKDCSINQLIDSESREIISCQQLKLLREELVKGKLANWFKVLEEIIIENRTSRSIKQEFILTEKNEIEKSVIEKMIASMEKKVLTKHWKLKLISNNKNQKLEMCK
ncbi:16328_t:CDS:2 [Gigaspora margarita]|uniref:16328_t:CDS:1 n=1 Tax=Gigaspora margarita TaxID=4874 RepID=A0ABN7UVU4_GIGMA|nr:16328_t:CDS:2 [Gigaspora margarita]